jgi:tripartite-type tricarboxylate transporter receptor subunit TctC
MIRKIMGLFLTISFVLSLGLPATAAEFPTKHITLIIPMTAGGSMDVTGRALGNAAKKFLGQSIISEHIPGGGGTVGLAIMVKKPADGYTIAYIATNNLNINWHMREMSFHPIEDVSRIIRFSGMPSGIVVRADSQWKTLQEFVQYAKQNPQKISYATAGIGLPPHLAMEELAILAGNIQWMHIPYKGGGECNTALLGGHVDAMAGGSFWAPLVDAGKFRLLASVAPFRFTRYSQVPTLKEVGYDVAYSSPLDILGPKGMPKPILNKLHDALKKAMEDPEVVNALNIFDMVPIYLNPEDLDKASRQEFDHMGKIVQKLGLQKK